MAEPTIVSEEKKPESGSITKKEKRSFWKSFGNFLMMGGFMLVLILVVVLAVVISLVFKCK